MAGTKIVAASDLTPRSAGAIRLAGHLAGALGGEVTVIHVTTSADLGDLDSPRHEPERKADHLQQQAEATLRDQVATLLGGTGVPFDTRVVFGDPKEEILGLARRLDADFITITVENRSRLGKLLMGSHSQQVLLESEIPVIGVKPEWVPPAD